jgi:hypothetical protein
MVALRKRGSNGGSQKWRVALRKHKSILSAPGTEIQKKSSILDDTNEAH